MEPLTGEGHPHPKFPMELSPRELARRALPPQISDGTFCMEKPPFARGLVLSEGIYHITFRYYNNPSFQRKERCPKGVILFSGSIGKMGWG
jgi:hypothetical protein